MLKFRIFFCSALGWARPWGSLAELLRLHWQASELCHHSNKGEGKATWVISPYLYCGKHKTSGSRASPVVCSTGVVAAPAARRKEIPCVSQLREEIAVSKTTYLNSNNSSVPAEGSGTNENNVTWRHIPIACSYLLWRERYHMAIAMRHAAPKASPLKTGLAVAQCHKLSCPHSSWVVHRALEDLLCCLCLKQEVNKHNLHLNIKYWAIALLECRPYVTGMKGDGVLPEWGFSICSNSPYRPEGLE